MQDVFVYRFTQDEKRVVGAAYQRYLEVLGVIAQLHNLIGNLVPDSTGSGFINNPMQAAPAPPAQLLGAPNQ